MRKKTQIEPRISVRIPARLGGFKERLAACCKKSGIGESDLVLGAISAVCEYVEKHGEINFPVSIRARSTDELIDRLEAIWRDIFAEREKRKR